MSKITDKVTELAKPVVEEEGCSLWDVEYVREAGSWFLRIFIDKDGVLTTASASAAGSTRFWTRLIPFLTAMFLRSALPGQSAN